MMKNICAILCLLSVILTLSHCSSAPAPDTNLLVNGDAELPKHDSVPAGWLNVQGHWFSPEGDSTHQLCGFAQHGQYLFFAGNDTLGILQQDVDISGLSKPIDAGKQRIVFSGYAESLDQGPNSDQARITVSGLDHDKLHSTILYDSDTTRSLNKWLLLKDTFLLSPATRFVRVQLIAVRHVGGDNDGYFDNASLLAIPVVSFNWAWILLSALGAAAIITLCYFQLKKKI